MDNEELVINVDMYVGQNFYWKPIEGTAAGRTRDVPLKSVTQWHYNRWAGDARDLIWCDCEDGKSYIVYKSRQSKAVQKIMTDAVKGMIPHTIR